MPKRLIQLVREVHLYFTYQRQHPLMCDVFAFHRLTSTLCFSTPLRNMSSFLRIPDKSGCTRSLSNFLTCFLISVLCLGTYRDGKICWQRASTQPI